MVNHLRPGSNDVSPLNSIETFINHERHLSNNSRSISIPSPFNCFLHFTSMITPRNPHSLRLAAFRLTTSAPRSRFLTCSAVLRGKDPKMSSGPPKHEMAYFPNMTDALPSKSGEFRRVLWTGLYSQVVLMTVPVGGDIGDEVRNLGLLLIAE